MVSGLIQPDSGQWTLAHWQGQTIARYIRATRDNPEAAARIRGRVTAEADRRCGRAFVEPAPAPDPAAAEQTA